MKRRIIVLMIIMIFCFSTTALAYQNKYYSKDLKIGLKNMASTSINVILNGNYYVDSQIISSGTSSVLRLNGGKIDFNGNQYDEITFVPEKDDNTIRLEVGSKKYNYLGSITFKASSGTILPINKVNIENYLKGVVAYEMSNSFPLEALKAQAVAARNYALAGIGKHQSEDFDLCDTVDCQVYRGYNSSYTNVINAVDETRGRVLLYNDELAYIYYSASDGGYTEASGNIWSKQLPYLIVKQDEFENEGWPYGDKTFTSQDLDKLLKSKGYITQSDTFLKIDIDNIERNESGRVSQIDIIYKDINGMENVKSFNKEGPRTFLSLPSSYYNVVYDAASDTYTFSGKGYGHGVGMSQIGAKNRANAGQTFEQILSFYFEGTYLQKLDDNAGEPPADNSSDNNSGYTPPSIKNVLLSPNLYTNRPAVLQVYVSGGRDIQYKFEILKNNKITASQDYRESFRFEFTPLESGTYKARVYLRDKSSLKEYDDVKDVDFEVLKEPEPSRGGTDTGVQDNVLKKGMKGSSVSKLQRDLKALGYDVGTIDGQFGGKTYTAVVEFQKSKGIKITGIVDKETMDEINKSVTAKGQGGKEQNNNQNTNKNPDSSTSKPQFTRTLKSGMTGEDVKNLQNILVSLGYDKVKISGNFEGETLNAVKDFQVKNGLAPDGMVGKLTAGILMDKADKNNSEKVSKLPSRGKETLLNDKAVSPNLKKGMKSDEVRKLQEALKLLSYNIGSIDGTFGNRTEEAVKSFQKSSGLNMTGIVDVETAKKINEKIR